jgi:pimeloyl-ACP methyl ester carboxylesterase
MVHGNPTWSFFYHPLIARLHQQYRCVAVDHIGCGLSDKPSVYLSLDDRIDHLTQVVESLDLRDVTLVAHDWGGAIGMGTLLRCRERFARIVLLNTAAFRLPCFRGASGLCRIPVLGRLAVQGWNVFARAAISMASERAGGLPLKFSKVCWRLTTVGRPDWPSTILSPIYPRGRFTHLQAIGGDRAGTGPSIGHAETLGVGDARLVFPT